MKKVSFFLTFIFSVFVTYSQSMYDVTENEPFVKDDVEMGYNILNSSTKEVRKKGDQSRYEVSFYITNKSKHPKVVLYSQTGISSEDNNDDVLKKVVRFDCLNATGARLTSKNCTLNLRPFSVIGKESRTDCNGKYVTEKKSIQIGFYIGAGETISNKVILIVPLNEQLNVKVAPLQNFTQL